MAPLKEYRRVLKPGGGCFIATVGPDHAICKDANYLGNHQYRVMNFDFRDDKVFFFFEKEAYFNHCLSEIFDQVEVGRITEKLMKCTLDSFVAFCR